MSELNLNSNWITMLPPYDKTPGWYRSGDFSFNKLILENFDIILDEAARCFAQGLFSPHEQSREFVGDTRHSRVKLAEKWHCFFFRTGSQWNTQSQKHAPQTYALLSGIEPIQKQQQGRVYFSIIPANSSVTPHVSNLSLGARSRHQLCLMCDDSATVQNLWIEVNGDRRTWQKGNIISFDDHFMHSAQNNTDQDRMVLLYDSV